jgi:hypothetical protein
MDGKTSFRLVLAFSLIVLVAVFNAPELTIRDSNLVFIDHAKMASAIPCLDLPEDGYCALPCDRDSDCSTCYRCLSNCCIAQTAEDGNGCAGDCDYCSSGRCVDRSAGATTECGTCEKCNVAGGSCVDVTATSGKSCNSDCTHCVSGSCDTIANGNQGGCDAGEACIGGSCCAYPCQGSSSWSCCDAAGQCCEGTCDDTLGDACGSGDCAKDALGNDAVWVCVAGSKQCSSQNNCGYCNGDDGTGSTGYCNDSGVCTATETEYSTCYTCSDGGTTTSASKYAAGTTDITGSNLCKDDGTGCDGDECACNDGSCYTAEDGGSIINTDDPNDDTRITDCYPGTQEMRRVTGGNNPDYGCCPENMCWYGGSCTAAGTQGGYGGRAICGFSKGASSQTNAEWYHCVSSIDPGTCSAYNGDFRDQQCGSCTLVDIGEGGTTDLVYCDVLAEADGPGDADGDGDTEDGDRWKDGNGQGAYCAVTSVRSSAEPPTPCYECSGTGTGDCIQIETFVYDHVCSSRSESPRIDNCGSSDCVCDDPDLAEPNYNDGDWAGCCAKDAVPMD